LTELEGSIGVKKVDKNEGFHREHGEMEDEVEYVKAFFLKGYKKGFAYVIGEK